MNAELSRRLGSALGTHVVTPEERTMVARPAGQAMTWDDLPDPVRRLVEEIERRPLSPSTPRPA